MATRASQTKKTPPPAKGKQRGVPKKGKLEPPVSLVDDMYSLEAMYVSDTAAWARETQIREATGTANVGYSNRASLGAMPPANPWDVPVGTGGTLPADYLQHLGVDPAATAALVSLVALGMLPPKKAGGCGCGGASPTECGCKH
jgi:hypothetical protein